MTTKTKVSVCINNQQIPWSFVQKVRRICGGDWDQTLDIFWKCRTVGGHAGIIRYISKGLYDYAKGNRWLMISSRERENGQMESIRNWWNGLYNRHPRTPVMSVKDVFKAISNGDIC